MFRVLSLVLLILPFLLVAVETAPWFTPEYNVTRIIPYGKKP
jgi:hypothetical protein